MKRFILAALLAVSSCVPAFADEACDAPRSPVATVQADMAEQNATMRPMPADMAQAAIGAYRAATGDKETPMDSAYLVVNDDGDKALVILANGACAVKMSKVVPLRALSILIPGVGT